MPSVNLIWEQRRARQKGQRVASILLAIIGLGLLFMTEEVVRTVLKRRQCEAGIQRCEERIKKAKPLADRNLEVQGQIAALEPTVNLVQEAQRITLRWVRLLGELDASVPDPKQVYLSQCSFTTGGSAPGKKELPGTIGTLNLTGTARSYVQISETMRRLAAGAHLREVRLQQAQLAEEEGIRFTCRAQFHIPENEEVLMAASEEAPQTGRDYSAVLQKAGEGTVLNRVPVTEKDS